MNTCAIAVRVPLELPSAIELSQLSVRLLLPTGNETIFSCPCSPSPVRHPCEAIKNNLGIALSINSHLEGDELVFA